MRLVDNHEITLMLGIVVEKRASKHPWAKWNWMPTAVFMDAEEGIEWKELVREENFIQYHAATLPLNLHRKETEALRLNLMLDQPELYVILQENEDHTSEFDFEPKLVTASSYDAQDYLDTGDDIIEKVAMPDTVAAIIQAFVEQHHVEEEFKKRKRDRLNVEEQKFGKSPIFVPHTKH